jgi:hypothetical protein
MRENFDDADELRLHRLGALASIAEVARQAIDEDGDPAVALAYIIGRADGALGHVRPLSIPSDAEDFEP